MAVPYAASSTTGMHREHAGHAGKFQDPPWLPLRDGQHHQPPPAAGLYTGTHQVCQPDHVDEAQPVQI
jgi:hypothetical protein